MQVFPLGFKHVPALPALGSAVKPRQLSQPVAVCPLTIQFGPSIDAPGQKKPGVAALSQPTSLMAWHVPATLAAGSTGNPAQELQPLNPQSTQVFPFGQCHCDRSPHDCCVWEVHVPALLAAGSLLKPAQSLQLVVVSPRVHVGLGDVGHRKPGVAARWQPSSVVGRQLPVPAGGSSG